MSRRVGRPRGTLAGLLLSSVLAGGLVLTTGGPTVAECTGFDQWPSFRAAVPTASTVFVGTVVETPGGAVNSRFVLRVDEVLRGSAPDIVGYSAFRSGVPLTVCPGDSVLRVRNVGERLAFAYGARLPGLRGRIDAVAFVGASRPDHALMPGMERLPMWRIRALVGRPGPQRPPTMAPVRLHAELPPDPVPSDELVARLVTEEVEPGVWRVLGDGTRELGAPCPAAPGGADCLRPARVVAGLDGSVWILDGLEPRSQRLLRLGDEAVHQVRLGTLDDVEVGPGGTLWAVAAGRLHSFDGQAWTLRRNRPKQGRVTAVEVDTDGMVWVAWSGRGASRIGRLDARGWSSVGFPDMVGSQAADAESFALGPHGVWLAYEGTHGAAWLLYFGEDRWRIVAPTPAPAAGLDVGLDGTVWAYHVMDPTLRVLYRLSSHPMALPTVEATFTDAPIPHGLDERFMQAGPDGSAWLTPGDPGLGATETACDGLARFDGETWTHYLRGTCVRSFDIGPDGAAFVLASQPCPQGCAFDAVDLFVISPEPVSPS